MIIRMVKEDQLELRITVEHSERTVYSSLINIYGDEKRFTKLFISNNLQMQDKIKHSWISKLFVRPFGHLFILILKFYSYIPYFLNNCWIIKDGPITLTVIPSLAQKRNCLDRREKYDRVWDVETMIRDVRMTNRRQKDDDTTLHYWIWYDFVVILNDINLITAHRFSV